MNSYDWDILLTLEQTCNITKAAQQLFLSQPSLTYRIHRIEGELGISLFHRVPTGILLTPQGERLAAYARQMKQLYRSLQDDLHNMEQEITGTLRLAVASAYANADLPQLLHAFSQEYPAVTIHLRSIRSDIAYQSLINGEVDIAIVRGKHQWSEEQYLLREEPMVLVSSVPVAPEALPQIPMIQNPTSDTHRDNLLWWQQSFSVPPLVQMEVDNMETGLRMVRQGLGWMVVPALLLRNAPEVYSQPLIWKDGSPYTRKTWALCRSISRGSRVVDSFLQFLLAQEQKNRPQETDPAVPKDL